MQDLSRLPYGINALSKAALVKDVPYRERYETPMFIDCTEQGGGRGKPPRATWLVARTIPSFFMCSVPKS